MAPVHKLKPLQATRASTLLLPPLESTPSFIIDKNNKSYKHQYANIYFIRLRLLRQFLEKNAFELWNNAPGKPTRVPRVLEVVKGQLCYIIGTIYMEMPMKPNVMEDIARDHSILPPPPPKKFYSDADSVMIEDESGRIRLVGDALKGKNLVTGVITSVLGAETPEGDFEVVDICFPGMAPQAYREDSMKEDFMGEDAIDVDEAVTSDDDEWVGFVSGLEMGSSTPTDAQLQMLTEYLTGEEGGEEDQLGAARISRLIIAGNSVTASALADRIETPSYAERKAKKRGLDPTTFEINPIYELSAHLLDIARVMPIHILPGPEDPSGTIMPQQPFPKAIFGEASTKFETFYSESNPTYINIGSSSKKGCRRSILVNSGQPLNDMFKYLPSPPITRLSILESTLKWRHMSPTAPDTLWCHPYFTADPFIIKETPHIYVVGAQPEFGTKLIAEQTRGGEKIRSRIVLLPSFAKSGTLVVVNIRTLEVRCVNFAVEGMMTADEEDVLSDGGSPRSPSRTEPKWATDPSSNSGIMDSQQD